MLSADQLVVVGEVGVTYFHNLPSDQKFQANGVYLPNQPFSAIVASSYATQPGGYLTQTSWGYRIAARLNYENALFGGALAPRIGWSHDVHGMSPVFNEGTKSLSVGASWDYQRRWVVDAGYTMFFGGNTYCGTDQPPPGSSVTPGQPATWCSSANPLKDRDFYSVSVSYSF